MKQSHSPCAGILRIIPLLLVGMGLTSCFTGIESTKKITLSREERKQTAPTAEESFLSDIHGEPHTQWRAGKPFYVADERASVMIDAVNIPSGNYSLVAGDTLQFRDARAVRTPDGRTRTTIIFNRGDDEFRYMARETPTDVTTVMSDAIPGLIDPDMIEAVRARMLGERFWTMSAMWLDDADSRMQGRKYAPVLVTAINPGTMVFPVRVSFTDDEGNRGSYLMNFGSAGTDSRGFQNLFSLTDPRRNYPSFTDEVWSNICNERVVVGMTKEECRVAKGNPSDVYAGHDYSKSMLVWVYPDATTLYFEDDILTGVKGYQ